MYWCPLYDLETASDSLIKLCTNVKFYETRCRIHKLHFYLTIFWIYGPLNIENSNFCNICVRAVTIKLFEIFSWNFVQI